MRVRRWSTVALLLAGALVGLFAATAPPHGFNPSPPAPVPELAGGTVSFDSEAAALRSPPETGPVLQQRLSKARVLSLVAVLAAMLGLLALVGRRSQGHIGRRSSSLPLRRHTVALRAPPSLQPA